VNAIPCVICTASTEWSGRPMDVVRDAAIHRVSLGQDELGTGVGGQTVDKLASRSARTGETRRAKMVRRGALDATMLARGRVGGSPRHAATPIESHPLLSAGRTGYAGLDRAPYLASHAGSNAFRARTDVTSRAEATVWATLSRTKAPKRDCHTPRSRIEAAENRIVPTGCVDPRTSTHRHPRGKGVHPA